MKTNPFKNGLLAAGALALALVSTAATVDGPTSAAGIGGPTRGEWDLPSGREDGFATGVLVDAETRRPAFRMRARLVESASTSLMEQRGTINGQLFRPSTTGVATRFPIYSVNGRWRGNRRTGEGSFVADISVQRSPLGPIVQIGKMAGDYRDGASLMPSIMPSMIRNPVGNYRGKWRVNGL